MRGSRRWKRRGRRGDGWLEFSPVGQAGQKLPPINQKGPGPYSGQECAFSLVRREQPKRDGLVGWPVVVVLQANSLHADHRDLQTTRSCWRYRARTERRALLSCKRVFHVSGQDKIGRVGGMVGIHPSSNRLISPSSVHRALRTLPLRHCNHLSRQPDRTTHCTACQSRDPKHRNRGCHRFRRGA